MLRNVQKRANRIEHIKITELIQKRRNEYETSENRI